MATGIIGLGIRFFAEPVRFVSSTAIAAKPDYQPIGTALVNPCRQFLIQNMTDQIMMFSFDGTNDHFPLSAGSYFLDDITSNKTVQGGQFALAQNVIVYVRYYSAAPTTSTTGVFFSSFYAVEK